MYGNPFFSILRAQTPDKELVALTELGFTDLFCIGKILNDNLGIVGVSK